jgi:antitoxin VapB
VALSLKNPETERLAKELARATGESVTRAVTIALREKLEREEKSKKREGRLEWLEELTKQTAPLLKDLPSSDKIGDLLFDKETGLPLDR